MPGVTDASTGGSERIARRIARAGLCSRREAERWIAAGRVSLNGEVLTSPAVTVVPEDKVVVDGKPLPEAAAPRLWRYNKPRGLLTTHHDDRGRRTVFDALPKDLPRVISAGRLDVNSEGLLLLTNDGDLARHLELPATGLARRYRVRAHGTVDEQALARLSKGVTIDGIRYGAVSVRVDRRKQAPSDADDDMPGEASNTWFTVNLREGKNREVRRVFEHVGLDVNRLIRLSYGPFQLGSLKAGHVEEVPRKVLRDQLGKAWAERLREPTRKFKRKR